MPPDTQPTLTLGSGTKAPNAMLNQPGLDIQALLQMILQSQQSMQSNMLNAATKPQSKIAQSAGNERKGLASWYDMNPHALQGEGYAAGRRAQVQGNKVKRAAQGLEQRNTLADLLNQLSGKQNDFLNNFQGDISKLPVNPFIGAF